MGKAQLQLRHAGVCGTVIGGVAGVLGGVSEGRSDGVGINREVPRRVLVGDEGPNRGHVKNDYYGACLPFCVIITASGSRYKLPGLSCKSEANLQYCI